jgi:predicted O-methyltransferase YrrM
MRCSVLVVAVFVGLIGVLVGTSPSGVTPPLMPSDSTVGMLPPWPIFRVAIAVNEFFEAAAWATRPPPVQIKSLATAYWQTEVSYSLTASGVIDAIGEKGGVSCTEVAARLSLKQDFLCRMMAAGVGIKLMSVDKDGLYSLTDASQLLRKDHPGSLRSFMLMINEEAKFAWRAVGTDSQKSGVSGFKAHFGQEWWEWHSASSNAGQMAQFDSAMKSFSAEISGSLLADWMPPNGGGSLVCDIGGGLGHMVVAMAKHYPNLTGVVFDQPAVAARAEKFVEAQGLSARIKSIGGSFLDGLPAALSDCDAFYLKFIIHDWADEEAVTILKGIKQVAKKGAVIVSTDFIRQVDGAAMEMNKALMDINMMACNPAGARERTFDEYKQLYTKAGITGDPPELLKMRDLVSTVVVAV